jgi:hypothetical protein
MQGTTILTMGMLHTMATQRMQPMQLPAGLPSRLDLQASSEQYMQTAQRMQREPQRTLLWRQAAAYRQLPAGLWQLLLTQLRYSSSSSSHTTNSSSRCSRSHRHQPLVTSLRGPRWVQHSSSPSQSQQATPTSGDAAAAAA